MVLFSFLAVCIVWAVHILFLCLFCISSKMISYLDFRTQFIQVIPAVSEWLILIRILARGPWQAQTQASHVTAYPFGADVWNEYYEWRWCWRCCVMMEARNQKCSTNFVHGGFCDEMWSRTGLDTGRRRKCIKSILINFVTYRIAMKCVPSQMHYYFCARAKLFLGCKVLWSMLIEVTTN